MKRACHILLILLIGFQPMTVLWADMDEDCPMTASQEQMTDMESDCSGCGDDCDNSLCEMVCAVSLTAIRTDDRILLRHATVSEFFPNDTEPLLLSDDQPSLRPPISS